MAKVLELPVFFSFARSRTDVVEKVPNLFVDVQLRYIVDSQALRLRTLWKCQSQKKKPTPTMFIVHTRRLLSERRVYLFSSGLATVSSSAPISADDDERNKIFVRTKIKTKWTGRDKGPHISRMIHR